MRHDRMNGGNRLLDHESIGDHLKDKIIKPEELEALLAQAKEMRSRATTELLRRSGTAMVRRVCRWARPSSVPAHAHVDWTSPADRQPQGGL